MGYDTTDNPYCKGGERPLRRADRYEIGSPLMPKPELGVNGRPYVMELACAPRWVKFAAAVLQGLVNRRRGDLYLTWGDTDAFWLERYEDAGTVTGRETLDAGDFAAEAQHHFGDYFDGLLVYEEGLLYAEDESNVLVNVLTAVAGRERLIPVPAGRLEDWESPVVFDARGRWDSVDDAYEWLIDSFPELVKHGPLAHLHPKILSVRDYTVAHGILPIFYWEGMADRTKELFERVLYDTGPNQPVIGLWHVAHHEGLDLPQGITGFQCEHSFMRHISAFGKYLIVTERVGNKSYHAGVPRRQRTYRSVPEDTAQAREQPKADGAYITFNMSDGDNVWYMYEGFKEKRWWNHPLRGRIPVNWTIAPAMDDLMPGLVDYFYRTATPNDHFMAALGLDYMFMSHYALRYENREQIMREHFRALGDYMERLDLKVAWLWHDVGLTGPIAEGHGAEEMRWAAESTAGLQAILTDYNRRPGVVHDNANQMIGGIPVFHSLTAGGGGAGELAEEIRTALPESERPAFLHAFCVNWSHTPETLAEAAGQLAGECTVTDAETFARYFESSLRMVK